MPTLVRLIIIIMVLYKLYFYNCRYADYDEEDSDIAMESSYAQQEYEESRRCVRACMCVGIYAYLVHSLVKAESVSV